MKNSNVNPIFTPFLNSLIQEEEEEEKDKEDEEIKY
jgi:hypothetical protein